MVMPNVHMVLNKVMIMRESGTLFGIDKNGEWFYQVENELTKQLRKLSVEELRDVFTINRGVNGIPVFRDYWRHIAVKGSEGAAAFDRIRNAEYEVVNAVGD